MKVVLVTEVFARNMGYLENMLPKYLSRQGVDVHVVAMDLPPYYWMKEHEETYAGFSDPPRAGTVEVLNGYTLHVLPHRRVAGYMRMVGLWRKLSALRPDIVQTTSVIGWVALDTALCKTFLGFKFFTGSHTTASVFPLANQTLPVWNRERLRCAALRTLPGYFVSLFTEKCYGATTDCADVAMRFFGVPKKKMAVSLLGVDTELFAKTSKQGGLREKRELRLCLGFADHEIVCIYTGRFSEDKNPLLLAKAVEHLVRSGKPFRGLFVGNGVQAGAIQSCVGCTIHPFVRVDELGDLFRACDIGVWPTQESTSMLDAAACGLPIVVNDTIVATERVEGNGLKYKLNDLQDLARTLLLLRDQEFRMRLGSLGADKVVREFSWEAIAKQRLQDYEASLHGAPPMKEISENGTRESCAEDVTETVRQ